MNTITFMTRHKSYEDMKEHLSERHKQILEILKGKEMTTREIEKEMNRRGYSKYFDMNHVRPRLTELVKDYEKLIECGVKKDSLTKKRVAVYKKKE